MVSNARLDKSAIQTLLCAQFEVKHHGGVFFVNTPLSYDDGDLVTVVVEAIGDNRWRVSDGGDINMRLSYRLDERALQTDFRQKLIQSACSIGGVTQQGGIFFRETSSVADLPLAIVGLAQAAVQIMSVAHLTQERVRSAFLDDLRQLVMRSAPSDYVKEHWSDPKLDPTGLYRVDWRIEAPVVPIFIFALTTTNNVKDATIAIHQYERWDVRFTAVGIAENLDNITKKAWAQFSAVSSRAFPQIDTSGGEDRIIAFLRGLVQPQFAN